MKMLVSMVRSVIHKEENKEPIDKGLKISNFQENGKKDISNFDQGDRGFKK
jgi:hypothetical protein